MSSKVFISVGSAATPRQAQAADTIFRSLEAAGLFPRQMGRNEWSAEQPLRAIKRVIEDCHGAVVIAFARYCFPAGTEIQKDGGEKQLADTRITTVWNQIEAAMSYSIGIPILVIAEHGLHTEGLIEGRYDWRVYWTDFSAEELRSEAFVGYLNSWRKLVLDHENSSSAIPASSPIDVTKLTLSQFFGLIPLPQLWAAVSALFATIASVATAAFRAGSGRWPWQ